MRSIVRETYYKTVPYALRRFIAGRRREIVFRNAMAAFMRSPDAYAYPGNPVLIELIDGWGNEAWSAQDEYLAAVIRHALDATGPILECGSGLSSLLIAAVAKQRNLTHWILEHKESWRKTVQGYLDDYGMVSKIVSKPLKDYGEYAWYDVDVDNMPAGFDLVICDGPPGKTKGGRYGLMPCMKEKLKPGCIILLDDAGRKDEQAIAKRWSLEIPSLLVLEGKDKPYLSITLTASGCEPT